LESNRLAGEKYPRMKAPTDNNTRGNDRFPWRISSVGAFIQIQRNHPGRARHSPEISPAFFFDWTNFIAKSV
jgi:hypothetical protein